MKKEKREIKKLTLHKETLQILGDTSLIAVAGGHPPGYTTPVGVCIFPNTR
jgi:hypothetical protein